MDFFFHPISEGVSAELACLSFAVRGTSPQRYSLQRILDRRWATWADLDAIPDLPGSAFQSINRNRKV
jgi:hypothetical protein